MRRFHLFEFEDFSWFPDSIRNGGTDYLGFILRLIDFYEPIASILEKELTQIGKTTIVDFCSGNGGPIEIIRNAMENPDQVDFLLTDKFPNLPAWQKLKEKSKGKISFNTTPVDVLTATNNLKGFRTLFSAVHHFRPESVKTILGHAVKIKQPIGIFDSGDKHIGTVMGIVLIHPILFFFCTPFFKPFKWSRILFTYIIPLIPLTTIWDGVISIIRLYSPRQLYALALKADPENSYNWKFGKVKNKWGFRVSYLLGLPKQT